MNINDLAKKAGVVLPTEKEEADWRLEIESHLKYFFEDPNRRKRSLKRELRKCIDAVKKHTNLEFSKEELLAFWGGYSFTQIIDSRWLKFKNLEVEQTGYQELESNAKTFESFKFELIKIGITGVNLPSDPVEYRCYNCGCKNSSTDKCQNCHCEAPGYTLSVIKNRRDDFGFLDFLGSPGFLMIGGLGLVIILVIVLNIFEPENKAYYQRKIDYIESLRDSSQESMHESLKKGNLNSAMNWAQSVQKHQNEIDRLRSLQKSAPE